MHSSEINDRAYCEYGVPYESFRNLREERSYLISMEEIKEIARESPYGKYYKFYHLTGTDTNNVNQVIESKHNLLLDYSKHTKAIGHYGEDLIAKAVEELGFTEVEVRKSLGKEDIDVWCRDRNEDFYWSIESKNRRQEIGIDDVEDALQKAEKAASTWRKVVKPAIVSSSIYDRVPNSTFPIIPTGSVYVPNDKLYQRYKHSLGSWYIKIGNNVPSELVEIIDGQLRPIEEAHLDTEVIVST